MRTVPANRRRRRSAGWAATLLMLAVVVLIGALMAVNADAVRRAFREVRRVGDRQVRLHPWVVTNAPAPAPVIR